MELNMIYEPEELFEESLDKILEWREEKQYFKIRDELLKFNEADIAEMFEDLLEDPEFIESTIVVYLSLIHI